MKKLRNTASKKKVSVEESLPRLPGSALVGNFPKTQNDAPPGPIAMLGYARKLSVGSNKRTIEWMRELRE